MAIARAGNGLPAFVVVDYITGVMCAAADAGVYADCGISGTDTAKRGEFRRMLADCEEGKIDIILTKSISRFARNTVDLLETVRHLKSLGIEVRFEKEHINSLSEIAVTICLNQKRKGERNEIRRNCRNPYTVT